MRVADRVEDDSVSIDPFHTEPDSVSINLGQAECLLSFGENFVLGSNLPHAHDGTRARGQEDTARPTARYRPKSSTR